MIYRQSLKVGSHADASDNKVRPIEKQCVERMRVCMCVCVKHDRLRTCCTCSFATTSRNPLEYIMQVNELQKNKCK